MLRHKIFNTLLWNLITIGVGLVNGVLLGRLLGPAVRGEVAAAMHWPTMLIYLSSIGLFPAVTYFSAQFDSHRGRACGTAIALAALCGVCGLVAGFLIIPKTLASQQPYVITASRIHLAIVPLSLMGLCGTNVLLGALEVQAVNHLRAIVPCGYLLGTGILGVSHELTLMNVVLLHVGLNLLFLLSTIGWLAHRGFLKQAAYDRALASNLVGYGAKVHIGTIGSLANQNLAQAAMEAFSTSTNIGLYVTAFNAAGIIQTLAQAVQMVTLPSVAKDSSDAARRELLERIFRYFWTACLLLTPPFALALPALIVLLFGRQYTGSIIPAEILLVGFVFSGSRDLLVVGSQASGKPLLGSAVYWLGAGVTTVLLYLLLPRWGIIGAAVATSAASMIQLIVSVIGLHRSTGLSPAQAFRVDVRQMFQLVRQTMSSLNSVNVDGSSIATATPSQPIAAVADRC